MSRALRLRYTLLLPLFLAACDGGPPWGTGEEEESALDRDVFGPTAAYDRRLVFLGPGEDLPTAAIFDFAALSDSTALRRGVRARIVDGVEWVALMDEGWEMEPMRDPWRLVPHGPLEVIVGDAGEMDALLFRGEVDLRLEPGATIAEYSPDPGTQLVLRQARLRFGSEPVPGILLDAQLARAVHPAAIPPRAPDTVAPGAPDSVAAGARDPAAEGEDSIGPAPDPAPAARPGAEALLVDNSGYYAVFAASAGGTIAWLNTGGRDDVRRGARLEATAWETLPESGLRAPTAWRVLSPGEALTGELRAESADRTVLDGPEPGVLGYVVVSGWIEDRAIRRNVYGMVRHVR
ncbi:MAG TPA: hypothetical protein VMM12_12390 [Longimicrobiales bacterium]|nr:hypothetical protein [Longimicrobiales bacterium]